MEKPEKNAFLTTGIRAGQLCRGVQPVGVEESCNTLLGVLAPQKNRAGKKKTSFLIPASTVDFHFSASKKGKSKREASETRFAQQVPSLHDTTNASATTNTSSRRRTLQFPKKSVHAIAWTPRILNIR